MVLNFFKPKDWAFRKRFLKSNLFYVNNLHRIEDENIKLSDQ